MHRADHGDKVLGLVSVEVPEEAARAAEAARQDDRGDGSGDGRLLGANVSSAEEWNDTGQWTCSKCTRTVKTTRRRCICGNKRGMRPRDERDTRENLRMRPRDERFVCGERQIIQLLGEGTYPPKGTLITAEDARRIYKESIEGALPRFEALQERIYIKRIDGKRMYMYHILSVGEWWISDTIGKRSGFHFANGATLNPAEMRIHGALDSLTATVSKRFYDLIESDSVTLSGLPDGSTHCGMMGEWVSALDSVGRCRSLVFLSDMTNPFAPPSGPSPNSLPRTSSTPLILRNATSVPSYTPTPSTPTSTKARKSVESQASSVVLLPFWSWKEACLAQ